ncbi:MAG: hypothetical protein ABSE04_03740 [Candidatus Microgenomates bacterium]|jgi:hypothetical protein
MDSSLAAKKKSLTTLILVIGLLVIAGGTIILSKTGLSFIFQNKAAAPPTTATGLLQTMNTSNCRTIVPKQFAVAPYVLEGNFLYLTPAKPAPTPNSLPKTSFIGIAEAASLPTPVTKPMPISVPVRTPVPVKTSVPTPTPMPTPNYSYLRNCLPVYANNSMVSGLIGRMVIVTGPFDNGSIYASSIRLVATPSPRTPPPPTPIPNPKKTPVIVIGTPIPVPYHPTPTPIRATPNTRAYNY